MISEKLKAVTGDWFKDVQKELPPSPRRIIEEKIKILEPVRPDLIINDPEPNMKPSQTLTPSEPRTRMMVQHSNSHSSHQSQGKAQIIWIESNRCVDRNGRCTYLCRTSGQKWSNSFNLICLSTLIPRTL